MRLGYLYSRYPVISQTFCDREMIALERLGFGLEIGSVHAPLTSLRHEHISQLRAPIRYAPPQKILSIWEEKAKACGKWPGDLVDLQKKKYRLRVKAELRARNALYFAYLFGRTRVQHFHVHFANRAAHTAMFVKKISGIPFSVTAHGQDFMSDLGNDDLLRDICDAAEFVAAETDYSADLLRNRCPASASKIIRVYNGIDLDDFPSPLPESPSPTAHILSVGRLVAFKGFDQLIDACAELAGRGIDFVCEIIGDGPLRQDLQAKIDKLQLSQVLLLGSLSQAAVLEKLRAANIFALPSIVDRQGASDIFPTVIMEAMATERAVISTRLAGIPELVVDGETGLLVAPEDSVGLANALEQLIHDPELRARYGRAGRARVEQNFRIEQTVAPLIQFFETSCSRRPVGDGNATPARSVSHSETATATRKIGYLIDVWPDKQLPLLEEELQEMERRHIGVVPLVCEFDPTARLSRKMENLVERLEFLPDAMVIEAEWRANRALAQQLEEGRASKKEHAPGGIFLRQAHFALVLRKFILEKKISHLHATSSRALVCALILRELVDLTISVTIEPRPELSEAWIKSALLCCEGARLSDRKLLRRRGSSFLFDKAAFDSFPQKTFRFVKEKIGLDLTGRARFWQRWTELLIRWNANARHKMTNE